MLLRAGRFEVEVSAGTVYMQAPSGVSFWASYSGNATSAWSYRRHATSIELWLERLYAVADWPEPTLLLAPN